MIRTIRTLFVCAILGVPLVSQAQAALISCHNYGAPIVAHKHLPFGTRVRFYNAYASVVATVRDRGPFIRGREYDLDCRTMRALRIDGVGHVNTEILPR